MTLLRRAGGRAAGPAHFHAGVGQGEPALQSPGAGCCWMPRSSSTTLTWKTLTADRAPRNCWKRTGWPRAPRPRCCCLSATILTAHPLGGSIRQAVQALPNPGIKRQGHHPAPPQPRRQSAGQCRPLSGEVITRMRGHRPTLAYVRRRTAEGKSRSEIIRCLKRYVAREIFGYLCPRLALVGAARNKLLTDIGASMRCARVSSATLECEFDRSTPLPISQRGAEGRLSVHPRLLQPVPSPLGPWASFPIEYESGKT